MQSINLGGIKGLEAVLGDLLKELPEEKRALHEQLAQLAKTEVNAAIGTSLNDSGGKVKGWQVEHVGSGGGYAAIRAMGGKDGASVGRNSPGAITNYLENGHSIRRPGGKNRFYRARIKTASVGGRHFYRTANAAIEAKAIALTQKFADELAEKLGGG